MKDCLACGASGSRKILDFGCQPAANLLTDAPNSAVKRVSLGLRFCDSCGHAQQNEFYPPHELFSHYLYQSNTTKTLGNFFHWLASNIASITPYGSRVLEIASNDSSFLKALAAVGLKGIGIEPAKNLTSISRNNGYEVIDGFWPDIKIDQKYSRIVAMNVLAHCTNPLDFLAAISNTLTYDGLAFIQVSQAEMFKNFEFDTLYHEHYSFFCPSSLQSLAQRSGFKKVNFIKTNIHGGSIMAILGFDASQVDIAAKSLLKEPFSLGRLNNNSRPSSETAQIFRKRAYETCSTIAHLTKLARADNRKVVLVGAAAKAITVVQAADIIFDHVIDEAPLKISKFIPGTNMKIENFYDIGAVETNCLFLIGAWNFRQEIEGKLRSIRRHRDDLTAVYFPHVSIQALFETHVETHL
jgi:hypothetical protein